jgi:nitrosocyanin
VPSTIVAKKGQTVRLTLVNKVPSDPNQHGFAIPAFGVAEVVTRGENKTVTFTADKEGVFPTSCQLHPAHVGGQLVVLP